MKHNIYFKVGTIVIIALLLLIPAFMIRGLIFEREHTQEQAIAEVSAKWGGQQTIAGPFISIPYIRYIKETVKKDSVERIVQIKEYIHILPDKLDVNGEISPKKRERGIYEVVVYDSRLHFSGVFNKLDFAVLDIKPQNIQFSKAEFVVGIPDLRGIEQWHKCKGSTEC
jgi:inner membrane protein